MKRVSRFEKLRLISKEIDVYNSKVLFGNSINSVNLRSHFDIYNSDWQVENGWLSGKNSIDAAGMAVLKKDFPGNILLEFECRTLHPSTHDINFMWNTEWSDRLNS